MSSDTVKFEPLPTPETAEFWRKAPEIERGATYRFTLNHVLLPDDPFEAFPRLLVQCRQHRMRCFTN